MTIQLSMHSYLGGISGQWDILLLNLTSIGFTIFFRCLFFFTNSDVVTIKDEGETNDAGQIKEQDVPLT